MRVGFIGLGNIGGPMAARLVQAGLDPVVFDADETALRALTDAGARAATTCAGVAEQADHIGVCVRDDAQVAEVMLGSDGIIGTAKRGTVVAIHSTVLPDTVRNVAEVAAARGVGVVDAPITGGAGGARRGTLTYMAGGDDGLIDRCLPVFETSAAQIVRTGPLGSGATAKLCLSIVTYMGFLAAFEASLLARRSGLDADALDEVLRAAGAMTEQLPAFLGMRRSVFEQETIDGSLRGALQNFTSLAEKDLACALQLAQESDATLPGAELCRQLMARVYGANDE
jgi:3-hydroxyisobutyrate dehydrogenase-like beta-hydroxyacid dehydrogenase